MHAFKFYRRYWAAIGGLIFVALAFFVGLFRHQVPDLQRFMVLMYMALLFHQFEEYIFPGGFPAAANIGLFGEKENVNSSFRPKSLKSGTESLRCSERINRIN